MKKRSTGAIATLLLMTTGCLGNSMGPGNSSDDLAEYDELAAALEPRRELFLGPEADEIFATDDRLYWLEFPTFAPSLHSYSETTGQRVDYGFSIGTDVYHYEASSKLVVTTERQGDVVVYRAFAAAAPAQLLGEVSFPAPVSGARWWAYAVDATTVYIAIEGSGTVLQRWTPGQQPTPLLSFESELGVPVNRLDGFTVRGDTLLFVESGRLWLASIGARTATWLGNEQQITGTISFDGMGVLFSAANGPYYYARDSSVLVGVQQAIADSAYRFNTTYATMHHFSSSATLFGRHAVYLGQQGVFAFDLTDSRVSPIVLEKRYAMPRVVYSNPQLLNSGDLYIVGLESDSGSVGVDGPVYRIPKATSVAP